MSKRRNVVDYYKRDKAQRLEVITKEKILEELRSLQKSAAAVSNDKYSFSGEAIINAAVVRSDLNGYSKWAANQDLKSRADLLDDFFSHAINKLDFYRGVYFRDEGDCIVSIFSPHFDSSLQNSDIKNFCKSISGRTYGSDTLTAKCTVSVGEVAIFQKHHEVGSEDWSAEGHPFVRAARLEQTVESKSSVYYYKEDFEQYFHAQSDYVLAGEKFVWLNDTINLQVPGIGNPGGWSEIFVQEYVGD